MENIYAVFDYLPVLYKTNKEEEYIEFLKDSFVSNYEIGKYQFAYFAYHMIFMSIVYFQLSKVYLINSNQLKNIMLFTNKALDRIEQYENEKAKNKNTLMEFSPFWFSLENERTIMGLFISIGCDRENIKRMRSVVDFRNKSAHSTGAILIKTQEEMEENIQEINECIECIQTKCEDLILKCYVKFLKNSFDPETREWYSDIEQVNEVLLRGFYFSIKDISALGSFDVTSLSAFEGFPNMVSLTSTIKSLYSEEEPLPKPV